jgi:hypothetical protein
MVTRTKCPKCTRTNKKTLKAKNKSPKGMRKNKTARKHRRYGGAPPTDQTETPIEEEECAICQSSLADDITIKTNCGHTFHKKCLGRWCNTQTDANKTCPICRANIATLCEEIKPLNSLDIISHLDRLFFDIPGYAGVDVESKRMENHRIIHEYLDNPAFDPNVYDSKNRTPLYIAVQRSKDDVIDKLLKHPDINTDIRATQSGKTPLELAIASRNYKAIALFKKYKKVPKALKDLV